MIEHVIVYTCDTCGAKVEERRSHPVPNWNAQALRYPCLPIGWHELRGRLICNVHRIEVTVT